jgi:hypothetical protein
VKRGHGRRSGPGGGQVKESTRWQLVLAAALILLSYLLYLFHYVVFQDPHHILIYLVGDLAFLPVEVLLVTVVIHRLLEIRERRQRREKLQMVVGIFFSEFGNRLLAEYARLDPDLEEIRTSLMVSDEWGDARFDTLCDKLSRHPFRIHLAEGDVRALDAIFASRKELLIRLFENPLLEEHEGFSEVLRSMIHLSDEIQRREGIPRLPESDLAHLSRDLSRSYRELALEWVEYMRQTRAAYSYLFSLAVRTNPFVPDASPLVMESPPPSG